MHLQQVTFNENTTTEEFDELMSQLWAIGCFVRVESESAFTLHCTDEQRREARTMIEDWQSGDIDDVEDDE